MVKSFAVHLLAQLLRIRSKMSDSCVFCRIVESEAAATIIYRDDQATAFRDSRPVAPTHILIVPNRHIESVNALAAEDEQLVGHLFTVARRLAEQEEIAEAGYRLIVNSGPNGGQTVFHLHLHLIGGHRMRYPMG